MAPVPLQNINVDLHGAACYLVALPLVLQRLRELEAKRRSGGMYVVETGNEEWRASNG